MSIRGGVILVVLAMLVGLSSCKALDSLDGSDVYTIYRLHNPYTYFPELDYRPLYWNSANSYASPVYTTKDTKRERSTTHRPRRRFEAPQRVPKRDRSTNTNRNR